MPFNNIIKKVGYYLEIYQKLKSPFLEFVELLENDKLFNLNFERTDDKLVKFEIFGYPAEIFFSIARGGEDDQVYGKIEAFRTFIKDERDLFWHLYFDDLGNTKNEINGNHNAFSLTKEDSLKIILALLVDNFVEKYLPE